MEGLEGSAYLLAQHAAQRRFERLDHRDLHTMMAQRGCHLAANEAHPHEYRPPPFRAFRTDEVSVSHGAQVVNTLQFHTGETEPPVAHTCRN